MKMTQLKDIIREIINEQMSTMDEESQAAKDAKAQGLTNLGFGRWGKEGPDGKMTVTNISDKGKLVPYSKAAIQRKTGMTFGRGKNATTMYTPSGYGKAQMTEPGKVQRRTPRETPDQQRAANKPTDDLAPTTYGLTVRPGTPDSGQKIVDKVTNLFYDSTISDDWGTHDEPIPMDDFEKATGITRKAAKYFTDTVDDYDIPFSYDSDSDSVSINN
jgi:hypothetical protein